MPRKHSFLTQGAQACLNPKINFKQFWKKKKSAQAFKLDFFECPTLKYIKVKYKQFWLFSTVQGFSTVTEID